MAARSIFGQFVGIMEMSNLSGSGGGGIDPVEGKYVLKSGDSMSGDLTMQDASVDVLGGEVKVDGKMSRVLLQGGAGIRVEDGGGIVVADEGDLSVNGNLLVGTDLKVDGKGTIGGELSTKRLSAENGVWAGGAGVQVAPVPLDVVLNPGERAQLPNTETEGWYFTAAQDMLVTAIEWIYVEGPDGEYKKQWAIWPEVGDEPLLEGEVSDDDPIDASGQWRVHALPPGEELLLEEGKTYVIGGFVEYVDHLNTVYAPGGRSGTRTW